MYFVIFIMYKVTKYFTDSVIISPKNSVKAQNTFIYLANMKISATFDQNVRLSVAPDLLR